MDRCRPQLSAGARDTDAARTLDANSVLDRTAGRIRTAASPSRKRSTRGRRRRSRAPRRAASARPVAQAPGSSSSRRASSSLTRRIVFLNVAGLLALVIGILYLSQFRAGLIDARIQSLLVQGEIIAGAIAASATVETDTITIDPDRLLELQAGESYGPLGGGALRPRIPDQPGARRAGAAPARLADQHARAHL